MELQAHELKSSHEMFKGLIAKTRPGSEPSQIASEALEMALKELEDNLPNEFPTEDDEPISLDLAMAYLRGHTPPA